MRRVIVPAVRLVPRAADRHTRRDEKCAADEDRVRAHIAEFYQVAAGRESEGKAQCAAVRGQITIGCIIAGPVDQPRGDRGVRRRHVAREQHEHEPKCQDWQPASAADRSRRVRDSHTEPPLIEWEQI